MIVKQIGGWAICVCAAFMCGSSGDVLLADDLGRNSIASIANICKQDDTEARYACSYFVLGFVARMEFEENFFRKKPACLATADLHSLNKEIVRRVPEYVKSGWTALDLTALVLETARCKYEGNALNRQ